MFNQEIWHNEITERLQTFARNPWQDVMVQGAHTLLGYLAIRTLEPFLEAYQQEPIEAVLTLASINRGPGADYLVRRATQLRFQGARLLEREFHTMPELCHTMEHLIVSLGVVHLVRQRLNSSRDEWLRHTLIDELGTYHASVFSQIRHLLEDPGWKLRHEAICNLKHQRGNFTPSQLIQLSEALKDSVSDVRTAAARRLGEFAQTPPVQLVKALVHVALHDCDMKTRNAAARSLGGLRDRIASPEILDLLTEHLSHNDSFVRSATAMLLTELGDIAGIPQIVDKLIHLLRDSDPYVREAAAIALGRMGSSAVTPPVMEALTLAGQDIDPDVHEAAVESLLQLRRLRSSLPLNSDKRQKNAPSIKSSPSFSRQEPRKPDTSSLKSDPALSRQEQRKSETSPLSNQHTNNTSPHSEAGESSQTHPHNARQEFQIV